MVADWQTGAMGDVWPVFEPDLASDFARVTDERSLREFNGRYGSLGYHLLHTAEMWRRKETWQGDPVDWALAHAAVAAAIRGVISVINDVRSSKVKLNNKTVPTLLRALLSDFEKMGLEGVYEGEPRRFTGFVWEPPEALVVHSEPPLKTKFSARWIGDPIGTSYHVLSWVLNWYIGRIRFEFVSLDYAQRFFGMSESGPPRFGLELHWDSLLQVIYWQLAESVGGAFRQCRRCGRIFPLLKGKELYCNLNCGAAARSKKHRDKRREERKKRSIRRVR